MRRADTRREGVLLDVPAGRPGRAGAALRYVCPECWCRVELPIAPEEPPYCGRCAERMVPLETAKPPAGEPPAPAEQPALLAWPPPDAE